MNRDICPIMEQGGFNSSCLSCDKPWLKGLPPKGVSCAYEGRCLPRMSKEVRDFLGEHRDPAAGADFDNLSMHVRNLAATYHLIT